MSGSFVWRLGSVGVADIVATLKVETKKNFTFYVLFKAKPDIVVEICEKNKTKQQQQRKKKTKTKNKKRQKTAKIIAPSSLYFHF